jgi:hypothetical protein
MITPHPIPVHFLETTDVIHRQAYEALWATPGLLGVSQRFVAYTPQSMDGLTDFHFLLQTPNGPQSLIPRLVERDYPTVRAHSFVGQLCGDEGANAALWTLAQTETLPLPFFTFTRFSKGAVVHGMPSQANPDPMLASSHLLISPALSAHARMDAIGVGLDLLQTLVFLALNPLYLDTKTPNPATTLSLLPVFPNA